MGVKVFSLYFVCDCCRKGTTLIAYATLAFLKLRNTVHKTPKLAEKGTRYRKGRYLKLMIWTKGHLQID